MASTASSSTLPASNQPQLFGHPVGLYFLFFTELWERFSYYGMRALFTLFLTASVTSDNPGYGWSNEQALALYGWYTMLVYVASIPGGILADKWLGQKRAVMLGGLLLCAGHGILAVDAVWAFYTGCLLIVLGVGCLKPNISTMVGGLYGQGDDRRDKGFYIFYIGINIGAFLAGIIVGAVGENINWHYGFGLAGIGMLIGQITYIWGQRYLKDVGNPPPRREKNSNTSGEPPAWKKLLRTPSALITTLITLAGSAYVAYAYGIGNGLLCAALSVFIGLGMVIYQELNPIEKDRVMVLLLSFLIVIIFWGAFEQAGGLMNLYAKQKTDRFASVSLLSLLFAVGVVGMLARGIWGQFKKQGYYAAWYVGAGGLAIAYTLLRMYVFTEDPWEVPASVFQSVNSFFIFTLAMGVAAFWYSWKAKGRESSSLFKMAIGVIIMGVGFLFMSAASLEYQESGSSAMYWLILAYLFHTIGELCASPVALSFITKLAPAKYAAIMMGIYFAATGLGNKVAGEVGEWSQSAGELEIFTGIAIFCTLFGLLVILLLKPLKRLTHGAEEIKAEPQTA